VPFIQIIEYRTNRIDEFNAALDAWLEETKGKRSATRGVQTKDRDATNTYLQIVEFPTHEEAVANSNMPETSEFAAKLASLCEGPPTFRNLDVLRGRNAVASSNWRQRRARTAVLFVVGQAVR
jgi:hypothetical protein